MLLIWKELAKLGGMFKDCGPFCMYGKCPEGKMTCGKPIAPDMGPDDILKADFPEVYKLCDA
jgi:thymidylate synthase (FAD)